MVAQRKRPRRKLRSQPRQNEITIRSECATAHIFLRALVCEMQWSWVGVGAIVVLVIIAVVWGYQRYGSETFHEGREHSPNRGMVQRSQRRHPGQIRSSAPHWWNGYLMGKWPGYISYPWDQWRAWYPHVYSAVAKSYPQAFYLYNTPSICNLCPTIFPWVKRQCRKSCGGVYGAPLGT